MLYLLEEGINHRQNLINIIKVNIIYVNIESARLLPELIVCPSVLLSVTLCLRVCLSVCQTIRLAYFLTELRLDIFICVH